MKNIPKTIKIKDGVVYAYAKPKKLKTKMWAVNNHDRIVFVDSDKDTVKIHAKSWAPYYNGVIRIVKVEVREIE